MPLLYASREGPSELQAPPLRRGWLVCSPPPRFLVSSRPRLLCIAESLLHFFYRCFVASILSTVVAYLDSLTARISKRLGALAMLYAVVVVCFPRAFLGYHHPTDLLVGGLIGVVAAYLANLAIVRQTIYRPIVNWQQRHPSPFYAGMFLLTYQIDDLFNNVRSILAHILGIGY